MFLYSVMHEEIFRVWKVDIYLKYTNIFAKRNKINSRQNGKQLTSLMILPFFQLFPKKYARSQWVFAATSTLTQLFNFMKNGSL